MAHNDSPALQGTDTPVSPLFLFCLCSAEKLSKLLGHTAPTERSELKGHAVNHRVGTGLPKDMNSLKAFGGGGYGVQTTRGGFIEEVREQVQGQSAGQIRGCGGIFAKAKERPSAENSEQDGQLGGQGGKTARNGTDEEATALVQAG